MSSSSESSSEDSPIPSKRRRQRHDTDSEDDISNSPSSHLRDMCDDSYSMDGDWRGIALVFNNESNTRNGSYRDCIDLCCLFIDLKLTPMVFPDQDKEDKLYDNERYTQMQIQSYAQIMFIVFMSHGDENGIITLLQPLQHNCQGNEDSSRPVRQFRPKVKFVLCTLRRWVSRACVIQRKGSWLIQDLVNTIRRYSSHPIFGEWYQMCRIAANEMKYRAGKVLDQNGETLPAKSIPEFRSFLTKNLFLNLSGGPGMEQIIQTLRAHFDQFYLPIDKWIDLYSHDFLYISIIQSELSRKGRFDWHGFKQWLRDSDTYRYILEAFKNL